MTSPTSRSIPSDCASNGQEETGRLLPPASERPGGKKCKPELQSEYIRQVFRDVMHQHCRAQKATGSQGTLHGLFPPTHKTLRELTRVEGWVLMPRAIWKFTNLFLKEEVSDLSRIYQNTQNDQGYAFDSSLVT